VSEEDRARLYDWLCEQADKPLAEYLMSCLAPAPLPDVVTKDFFSAELSAQLAHYATREDLHRLETKFESRFDQLLLLREADRKEAKHQFRWLVGIGIAILGVIVGFGIFS